jgi:hypothetical protein
MLPAAPEKLGTFVKARIDNWGGMIRDAGMQPQ